MQDDLFTFSFDVYKVVIDSEIFYTEISSGVIVFTVLAVAGLKLIRRQKKNK